MLRRVLHRYERTEERDEHRPSRADAGLLHRQAVPELVDEDEENESDREREAAAQRIEEDGETHRPRGEEDLRERQRLQRAEEDLSLREEREPRGDRAADPTAPLRRR